ncbi:MAG: nucleotidyl transferase AbiEii/AbiGii toxin family protein [Chitinophagaceae bacterium]|jgi:predicted nucleotidyltransferase|nr:nucleotidyl transferase AbiEii/AbiGii toxin family protein [Chitinophagaceae bacterium]
MSKESITRIIVVYDALEELADEVVFVGGTTVALYADRPSGESRPTDDVDILVELIHYREYAAIEERLRSKGFINDIESGVIGRYHVQGIIVDVMPTGKNTLGFTNAWYEQGYATAMTHALDKNYSVRIFQPVYFLASKMEAFNDRGGGDGRWSSDFEDIVYVLNNRNSIWKELQAADKEVKTYLKEQFRLLLENEFIVEWISVHLDQIEQKRSRMIIGELTIFVGELNSIF